MLVPVAHAPRGRPRKAARGQAAPRAAGAVEEQGVGAPRAASPDRAVKTVAKGIWGPRRRMRLQGAPTRATVSLGRVVAFPVPSTEAPSTATVWSVAHGASSPVGGVLTLPEVEPRTHRRNRGYVHAPSAHVAKSDIGDDTWIKKGSENQYLLTPGLEGHA